MKKRLLSLALVLSMLVGLVPLSPNALAAAPDAGLLYRPFPLSGIPLAQYTAQEYPSDDHAAQLPLVDMFVQGGTPIIVAPATKGGVPILYKLNPATMAVTSQHELPIPADYNFYGKTILGGDGNLYTTVGYDNQGEDPDKVVMKVYKIGATDFALKGTAAMKAADGAPATDKERMERSIRKPLVGGLSAMSLSADGSKLYMLMGKENFAAGDGTVHQSNIAFTVHTSSMAASYGIDGKISYVSHSLNQKLLVDGNKVVTLDHGDAHPRALRLSVFEQGKAVTTKDIFDMPATKPDNINFTGFAVTGFEATPTSYLVTGTSCSAWDHVPWGYIRAKNVYLLTVDKKTLNTTVQWIVPEESIRNTMASEPRLVKLADGSMILTYTRIKKSLSLTRYQCINADGSLKGEPLTDIGMTVETAVQPVLVGSDLLFLGKNGYHNGIISKLNVANPQKPVPVSSATAAAAEEQFSLPVGETYYFNLAPYVARKDFANENAALPDPTLHFVPFTYVGTVNAYSLTNKAVGDLRAATNATPSDRSLFVSDHNLSIEDSWSHWFGTSFVWDPNIWHEENLMYGMNMGEHYRLRSMTGGSQMALGAEGGAIGSFGLPMSNEWDSILSKNANYIKNTDLAMGEGDNRKPVASWMQDNEYLTENWYAMRGGKTPVTWQHGCNSHGTDSWERTLGGFRPAIEVKNPTALGKDGLQCVTLHLGGATFEDKPEIKMVRAGGSFVAPGSYGMAAPVGKMLQGWSTAADGSGTVYKQDAAVPDGVTELYAVWEAAAEQFALTPGGTYYFDLSAATKKLGRYSNVTFNPAVSYGRTENGKPSPGLVPFTYVGTVDSYDGEALTYKPTAATPTTPRSLFLAQHTVAFKPSINQLKGDHYLYGKEQNGFILRTMTGGLVSQLGEVTPSTNEYDRILEKAAHTAGRPNWIPNAATDNNSENYTLFNLAQDSLSFSPTRYTVRGVPGEGNVYDPHGDEQHYGWRPIVQVANSPDIGRDDLKVITLDLNGGTFDGKETVPIVSAGEYYTAPLNQYTRPAEGTGPFYWSTAKDGTGVNYGAGFLVPSSVTTLYAMWDGDSPDIKEDALPDIYWQEECSVPLPENPKFGPYTWRLASGELPAGVTLSNGVLSGTPTQAGQAFFTLTATNAIGYSCDSRIVLNVIPRNAAVFNLNLALEKIKRYDLPALAVGAYDTEEQIQQGIQAGIKKVWEYGDPDVVGVTATIHKTSQTAPIPGTAENPKGKSGQYHFTATFSSDGQWLETTERTQMLTAPVYPGTDNLSAIKAAMSRVNYRIPEKSFPAPPVSTDADKLRAVEQYVKLSMQFAPEEAAGVTTTVAKGDANNMYVVTFTKGTQTKTKTIVKQLITVSDADLLAAEQMAYVVESEGVISIDQQRLNADRTYLEAIKTRIGTVMNAQFPGMTADIIKDKTSVMPVAGTDMKPAGTKGSFTIAATFTKNGKASGKISKEFELVPTPYVASADSAMVAAAKTALVDGAAEVLIGADQAAKTAAVQVYVNALLRAANVTGVQAVVLHETDNQYTVSLKKGAAADSKTIAVTITEIRETDAAAVARAKDAVVPGTVNVAYGAAQAAKTAAVQAYVDGLIADTGVTAAVTFGSGSDYNAALSKGAVTDSKTIAMTITEGVDPDIAVVENAKKLVVPGTVNVAYGADQAAKTAAVQAYVDGLIAGTGVTAAVTFVSGSDYVAALSKGAVTDSKTIAMTITEGVDPDIAVVENAKKLVVPGTVNVAYGADQAAKTAAVQAYVDGLIASTGVTAAVTFVSGSNYNAALSKGAAVDSKTIAMTVNVAAAVHAQAPRLTADLSTAAVTYNKGATSVAPLRVAAEVLDGGTITCEWYSSDVANTQSPTKLGITTPTYTPAVTAVGDTYYYCVATNTNTRATGNQTAATTSAFAHIKVVNPLVSIAITAPPTKTAYTVGERFNAAGMVVTATYTDRRAAPVTGYTVSPAGALTMADMSVTVSYVEGGITKTAAQAITVNNPLVSIAITKQPTKTAYTVGESFAAAGMVVTATYADGTAAPVTTYTVSPAGALAMADTSVTVSYVEGGVTKTAAQAITVNNPLVSIAITAPPAKTAYTVGERFNAAGMVVTATYTDRTTAAVTGYTVSPAGALTMASTSVTVSYVGGGVTKTAAQAITVKNPLVSIAITAPPTKTAYTVGERFDAVGMVVTATYADGTAAPVTTYTVLPAGALTMADTSVTVSYVGGSVTKTAAQAITVSKKPTDAVSNTVSVRYTAAGAKTHTLTGLPADLEGVTYAVGTAADANTILSGAPTCTNGVLSFTTVVGAVGQTAAIPVTVKSTNHKDFVVTVTVTLIAKNNVDNKITFADAAKTYTGSEISHEAATMAAGYTGAITYAYAARSGGTLGGNGKPQAAGTYEVTATYQDADNHGTKTAVLTINKAESEVIPTPDTKTYTYGDTITLAAAVGIKTRRAAQDKVEFFAGTTSLGTAAVSGGAATLAYNTAGKGLKIGANDINAVYGGSVNLNGSESDTITVTLQAKPLTVSEGSLAITKVYDGTTAAPAAIGNPALEGAIAGDAVTLNVGAIPAYDSAEVGTYTLSLPISLRGGDRGNYTLDSAYSFAAAAITPAAAAAPAIGQQTIKLGKTLEQLAAQIGTVTAGGVHSEQLAGTLTLDAPNFAALGLGTHEIPFTFAKDEADTQWANYDNAPLSGTVTVNITALEPQSISFAQSAKRVLYGDAAFTNLCTNATEGGGGITYASSAQTVATVEADTGAVTLVGAGSAIITATAAEVSGGFAQTSAQYALTVAPKTLTLTGVTVQAKDYDATARATLAGGTLEGVLEVDAAEVSFTLPAEAAFDTAAAGAEKPVTIGAITLTGARSGNYTLTPPAALTGEIRKATPTLTLGNLSQQQNSSGSGVTAVTAVLTPASADAAAAVEYYVLKTAAVPAKPAVPGAACNHTAGTAPCTAAADGACAHDDGCAYRAETPATPETPAVYEWTAAVPQLAGKYAVRAALPEDAAGANLNAVTEPVTGELTVSAYAAPGDDSDSGGSGGGTVAPPASKPSAPVTDPVTGNTNVSLSVKPVDKGGVSAATVPEKAVLDAIAAAKKEAEKTGGTSSVEIQIDAAKDAAVETVLTGKSLAAMAKDTDSLKISGGIAELTFDKTALGAIAGGADTSVRISAAGVDSKKLTEEQRAQIENAAVFNFTATRGKDTISDFGGGKVTVTLPYVLKNGETAENVGAWYLDAAGKLTRLTAVYDAAAQTVIFVIDHFSHYVVGYDKLAAWVNPFTDVAQSAWYFEAVRYAGQNGLFSGVSKNTFAPDAPMTRAMLWTVLYRRAGQPSKTDTAGTWYADAQAWAIAENISDGKNPGGNVTREQLATILYRCAKAAAVQTDMSSFADSAAVADFAKDGMNWAVENKILQGNQGKLNPQSNATRAEVAAMLQRFAAAQL